MKRTNYLLFLIILALTFAITGFDFSDLSYEVNKREYILFFVALVLIILYSTNKVRQRKK